MARIGLIAGWGKLPRIWAKAAAERGDEVYAYPLLEENTVSLKKHTEQVYPVNIGAFDRLIKTFREHGIEKVVMIGKVNKGHLFSLELDHRMQELLAKLDNLNDDSILRAIAAEFAQEGFEVLPQTTYLKDLFPEQGVLTEEKPTDKIKQDMEFGFSTALKIGELDIGQTVIVCQQSVIAVEAAEGTDQTIKRSGKLTNGGTVMAKVCKPGQDQRLDLPTLGLNTLKNLIEAEAEGLIIQAGKTLLLDKNEFLTRADKAGIAVVAVNKAEFQEIGGLPWDM